MATCDKDAQKTVSFLDDISHLVFPFPFIQIDATPHLIPFKPLAVDLLSRPVMHTAKVSMLMNAITSMPSRYGHLQ